MSSWGPMSTPGQAESLKGSASVCSANLDRGAMTIIWFIIFDKHLDSLAVVYVTFGLYLLFSNIQ